MLDILGNPNTQIRAVFATHIPLPSTSNCFGLLVGFPSKTRCLVNRFGSKDDGVGLLCPMSGDVHADCIGGMAGGQVVVAAGADIVGPPLLSDAEPETTGEVELEMGGDVDMGMEIGIEVDTV